MDKQIIMLVFVIVLVIFSGVQAVQINDLKEDISDGSISISGSSVNTKTTSYTQPKSAPSMVGGC